MAHGAPPKAGTPYTYAQKSANIPYEEEHETMVSVLGKMVGHVDEYSKLRLKIQFLKSVCWVLFYFVCFYGRGRGYERHVCNCVVCPSL